MAGMSLRDEPPRSKQSPHHFIVPTKSYNQQRRPLSRPTSKSSTSDDNGKLVMSKFVELGDEAFGGDMAGNQNVRRPQQQQQQQPYQQPHQQYQSPRAPPTVKFLDGSGSEEEEDAISLEEIEAPQSHNAKKHGSGGPRSAGADFRQKSARIGVEAKNYVEKKKTDFQVFSLEEFSADKRRVMIRAALGEFVVTTLFIFIVCAVGLNTHLNGHADSEMMIVSAVCTGFAAVALIYSFADVSGAHFNPAVTFSTIVTGKTTLAKGAIYIGAQLSGSILAMILLIICFPLKEGSNLTVPQQLVVKPKDVFIGRAFMMEFMLTFILVYVIYATAFDTVETTEKIKVVDDEGHTLDSTHRRNAMTIYTTSGTSKSGFAPLSIGFTLGFLCFLGGSVSGGAFNPARVFGAGLCSWEWDYMWLYWLADFLGGSLAGLLHQRVFASSLVKQQ